ncbi:MAG: carbohydrate ABC transporter permease [Spirochaetota bacterium]
MHLETKRGGPATARRLVPYVLIFPFFVFLSVFLLWPVGYSLFLSFTDWRLGFLDRSFIGLENYVNIFRLERSRGALTNTIGFAVATVSVGASLGLVLALALHALPKSRRLLQLGFAIPVFSTAAAMALIWRLFFDSHFGEINKLMTSLGFGSVDWLYEPTTARIAVVIVEVWRSTGYALLLFTAGLSAIPRELREAAVVDGASSLAVFRRVTWPLLAPTTLFVMIVLTARSFQSFDVVRVLTNGGPQRSTKLLAHILFDEAFVFFNTGFASSLAIAMAVLALSVGLLQFQVDRRIHYR